VTQPAPADQLSAAQLAALLTLVQAQAQIRAQLTQTAVAAAMTAFQGIANWWSADDVGEAIASAQRIIAPTLRQAAQTTSSYMAQTSSIIAGRVAAPARATPLDGAGAQRERPAAAGGSFRPARIVDVTELRKDMTEDEADDYLDGIRVPAWLILGHSYDGPADTIDDPVELAAAAEPQWLDPEDAYGRVADGYRFNVSMRGDSEEVALAKAVVRVAAVAETDVTLAVRKQYQESMSAHGALGFRRILHPELSETGPCALCVVAADRLYKKEDLLPIHGNCVPEGTRVAADNVLAVTRRDYAGPLVVLLTASGQELTITPNHPVLTDQGWIPAHLVDERHHLLRHGVGSGVVGRGPAEGDGPPLVEDVWRTATVNAPLNRRVVPLAPEDLHGDGTDGEVDVVATHGLLARVGDVSFGHPAGEHLLMPGHGFGVGFPGRGGRHQALLAGRHAARRGVGGRGDGGTLLAGGAGVELLDRLGLSTDLHPGFLQSQVDDAALDAVLLRQRQNGGPGPVLLDDLGVGKNLADPPRFDPAGFEFAGEGRHAYAQLGRDLRDRLAADVELDRVVDKRWIDSTGHVYNLHTAEGWYSGNNLIVSNCVCEVLPVYAGADPGITLNGQDLGRLYDAAGGNTRAALREVTVALAEHAELGPILVDANQSFRGPEQYARQKTSRSREKWAAQLEALEQLHEVTAIRVARGDPLEATYRNQQQRLVQLRRLAGVS
jgi:hypothetical protein